MKTVIKTIATIGVGAFLTSCGVQIQMETTVPAEVNLGKGTLVTIPLSGGTSNVNKHEWGLNAAMQDAIMAHGYYKLIEYPHPASNYVVMDVSDFRINRHEQHADFQSRVVVRNKYGLCLYSKTKETYAYKDSKGNFKWDSAYRNIADATMEELTPHRETYYERVSGVDENPSVEEGAKACKRGNWGTGRAYAEEALKVNPNEPEAYYLLGLIERYYKNYASSTSYFEKANSLKPESKYTKAIRYNAQLQRNEQIASQQLNG